MRTSHALLPVLLTALLLPASVAAETAAEAIARGDAAWARRADGQVAGSAAAAPIAEAVGACEAALGLDPASLEAHWKLVRALWFQGEYATSGDERRQAVFARGREIGERALDRLSERVGGRKKLDAMKPAERARALAATPEALPIHFWAAANWGLWGEAFGTLAAARQGVAGRIRDYAETVIALDPRYEQAGGHRILGRLHHRAPAVPFFSGWIDHDRGIRELRRAVELAPDYLYNRIYLIEALVDHGGAAARGEIDALLRDLLARPVDPATQVEDTRILEQARTLAARR